MLNFIKENYLQLVLLVLLFTITVYGMVKGEMNMINSILLAVLTGLNINSINK